MKYKNGRVTVKKAMKGGYDVCVGGVAKGYARSKVEAVMKANRIRKLQGKPLVKKVKKLAKYY